MIPHYASARSTDLLLEADVDRLRQYIKALGGPVAYHRR
jgi:hypothetical protein